MAVLADGPLRNQVTSFISIAQSEESFSFLTHVSFLLPAGVIPSEVRRVVGSGSAAPPEARLAAHHQEGEGDTGTCKPAGIPAVPPFSKGMQEIQGQQGYCLSSPPFLLQLKCSSNWGMPKQDLKNKELHPLFSFTPSFEE